jgi:hypothetical protein
VFKRFNPNLLIAAVLGAAVAVGLMSIFRDPAPSGTTAIEKAPLPAATLPMELPPNHPPFGATSPHGGVAAPPADPPTLDWKVPADWIETASPSPLRLATYQAPGGAEMSVARAGGTAEANIQRWLKQFDNAGADKREERTIHGLHMTVVEVAGTYEPSSMMTGRPTEAHPGWALLGAIVEASGSPYFFKLLGPKEAIAAARPSFERLLGSISPR